MRARTSESDSKTNEATITMSQVSSSGSTGITVTSSSSARTIIGRFFLKIFTRLFRLNTTTIEVSNDLAIVPLKSLQLLKSVQQFVYICEQYEHDEMDVKVMLSVFRGELQRAGCDELLTVELP
jgi:hypothetical protein